MNRAALGRVRRGALIFAGLLAATHALPAETIRILRDNYGVPHIFAATPAGAAYASGYAQAEDRLEEMMRNYRKAEGTMAEVFGEAWLQHDYRQRLWRHMEVSKKSYPRLNAQTRAMCEAFIAGVRQYMKEHPEEAPLWAPALEPWRIVALARYIIWGWPEGEIASELRRAGIRPDPMAYRGSNQWLLAPARTAMRAPIALIDPHLSWYGEFRWYEMRLYAGSHAISGSAVVGLPFPPLGHGRWVSVAMTTGGPDTSDVFEEEVAEGRYRFQGRWRPLEARRERIGVKSGDAVQWKEVTIESTHHGPIVARKEGKAYTAAIPYANEFRLIEQSWAMMNARNLAAMKKALAQLQLMQQNIMVGTVDGDIYYVRYGRVPVRPKGCDPSRPMPGTGTCEWQGIHPFEKLIQVANPPSGYMQNCNASPQWLWKSGSPFSPEQFKDRSELFNAPSGPPHQRAAMVLELLDAAKNINDEKAIEIAFSPAVYGAHTWQERIRGLKEEAPSGIVELILNWDGRAAANSRAALAFYLFKMALGRPGGEVAPPESLTDAQLLEGLRKAEARLNSEFPADAVYGSLFRVGRNGGERTYPVGGGNPRGAGMATPRAITFVRRGNQFVGVAGQTATQVVILTNPPRSYMVLPLGQSDRKESPHWDDQARELFSRSLMKSTYFLDPKELEKHVERRQILEY